MSEYIKKNGLLYSDDLKVVYGVDAAGDFTGRVPFGAHEFEEEAFSGCNCETISLPDSTDKVGDCLFQNSTNLKKVKLPSSLTKLSAYMFSGCSSLESVTMPLAVDSFPEGLFQGCAKLTEIPFRADIKELPESVCEGCASLKSVVIPQTVEMIGKRAFADCTSLETVVLPDGLYGLNPSAFEGCDSIRNVRISPDNKLLYISDKDGCLYERNPIGDEDILLIKVNACDKQQVSFYKENVDDETDTFFTDEDVDEEDDFFSSEIGAGEEELASVGAPVPVELVKESEKEINVEDVKNMSDGANSNIDDLFNDIMGESKPAAEEANNVAVSQEELEVLGHTMSVMNDSTINRGGGVSMEELENLFSASEKKESSENNTAALDADGLDSKTRILVDSAKFSKVINFVQEENVPADFDLFVVAEKTVQDKDGNEQFSEKLIKCAETFARIHDFRHVILLSGLPLNNEEFMMFYSNYISKKNIILACEAASPSLLSPYCKSICDSSRISLNKEDMIDQRKKAGIKTDSLIKLVIQDKYM